MAGWGMLREGPGWCWQFTDTGHQGVGGAGRLTSLGFYQCRQLPRPVHTPLPHGPLAPPPAGGGGGGGGAPVPLLPHTLRHQHPLRCERGGLRGLQVSPWSAGSAET